MMRAVLAGSLLAVVPIWSGAKDRDDDTTICHKPGTRAETTMRLSPQPARAHLSHGDRRGPCRKPTIALSLEVAAAVEATISVHGGSLSTTDSRGRVITLVFAPGSLEKETRVVLTPIAAVERAPVSLNFLGGGQFEPSGLDLTIPAILHITQPPAVSTHAPHRWRRRNDEDRGGLRVSDHERRDDNDHDHDRPTSVVGILYDGDGQSFTLTPVASSPGSIEVAVSHFSGLAAAQMRPADCSALTVGQSTDPATTAINTIACATPDNVIDEAINALTEWARSTPNGVLARLRAAQSFDALRAAIGTWTDWLNIAQHVERSDATFDDLIDEAFDAAAFALTRVEASTDALCVKAPTCDALYARFGELLQIEQSAEAVGIEVHTTPLSACDRMFSADFTTRSPYKVGQTDTVSVRLARPDFNPLVEWSSGQPTVAKIAAGPGSVGSLEAVSEGSSSIGVSVTTCALPPAKSMIVVDVLPRPDCSNTTIEVTPPELNVRVGASFELKATLSTPNPACSALPVRWFVSPNNPFVTIDAKTGVLTGLSAGVTTVAAALLPPDVPAPVTRAVRVTVGEDASAIALTPSGEWLGPVGQDLQFQAIVRNSRGDVIPGARVTWSSSAPEVLSVESNGLARFLAVGRARVIAQLEQDPSLSAHVSVDVFDKLSGSVNATGTVTTVTTDPNFPDVVCVWSLTYNMTATVYVYPLDANLVRGTVHLEGAGVWTTSSEKCTSMATNTLTGLNVFNFGPTPASSITASGLLTGDLDSKNLTLNFSYSGSAVTGQLTAQPEAASGSISGSFTLPRDPNLVTP